MGSGITPSLQEKDRLIKLRPLNYFEDHFSKGLLEGLNSMLQVLMLMREDITTMRIL